MKQILFVGAGSVGGFFGAHLAKNNPHVSFLLRPKTFEAVKRNGLTICIRCSRTPGAGSHCSGRESLRS
jgi:ketopantoate reductase